MTSTIPPIPFGGRRIGPGLPVVIIAEIGINHEGSVETCAQMIEQAATTGADAVKLQTIDADENYVIGTESHTLFKQASLSREETAQMFELARRLNMEPLTTAADFATVDWVDRLQPAAHKVSSGMLTNSPVIRHIARTGRTMLMSTGMAHTEDIDRAVAAARDGGVSGLALFQCTSIYPAALEQLNLATITWLETRYQAAAGFSDHSLGSDAAPLSVAAGARMIEKHFTLDRTRPDYDHRLSLEPKGFAELVSRVRTAELAMGDPDKRLGEAEQAAAERFHRILVARSPIAAGEELTHDNLTMKRPLPGTVGIPPWRFEELLGRRSVQDIEKDTAIQVAMVEDIK